MNNMTAFYIIFIVPFAILIFLQIKDFRSEKNSEEDDEYEEDDDEYEEDNDDDEEDDDDNDE